MELVRAQLILASFLSLCGIIAARTLQPGWIVDDDRCILPDDKIGICVDAAKCKVFYDFLVENRFTDEIQRTITKYICGKSSRQRFCCPTKLPLELERLRVVDFTKHANYKLLPKKCGISGTTDKITKGNETGLFQFPWAVVLKYNVADNPWRCGGSLISDRYVLTAAHCIRNDLTLTTIRLGEYNFDQDPDCEINPDKEITCAPKVQDFTFREEYATIHPSFNKKTNANDIALIRLPNPAIISTLGPSPVCIPTTDAELSFTAPHFTVIGWGGTENSFKSSILLKTIVPRIDIPVCARSYAPETILTDNQLCAGGKNEQDSCAGDSGGPLMTDYTDKGRFRIMQYGIVSVGSATCGKEDFPTVYTRVDKYIGWILNNMKP